MNHEDTSQLILQDPCGSRYRTTILRCQDTGSCISEGYPYVCTTLSAKVILQADTNWSGCCVFLFSFYYTCMRGVDTTFSPACKHFEYHPLNLLPSVATRNLNWCTGSTIFLAWKSTSWPSTCRQELGRWTRLSVQCCWLSLFRMYLDDVKNPLVIALVLGIKLRFGLYVGFPLLPCSSAG